MNLVKLEAVSLKNPGTPNEAWVQQQIANDPTLLGLGDLELKAKEKVQAGAGRLDLLLHDPESLKRYEVEVQLGPTDPSHIIRTVEYWDIERKRYPQYEHTAVIVAEDITGRFLNVIQLFNGAIPLIALKMTAYKVGDGYALTFVKVIDELVYAQEEVDDTAAPDADRAYWVTKASEKSVATTENVLLKLVNEIEPKAKLTYKKHYIGLEVDGSPRNFVKFTPRKSGVIMGIGLPQGTDVDEKLKEADIDPLQYDSHFKRYQIKVDGPVEGKRRETLLSLIREAWEGFGK